MLTNFILLAQAPHALPVLLIVPFLLLIGMIAAGPIFFGHFWEHNYKTVAVTLGLAVLAYYLLVLQDYHMPVHTLAEYVSFAVLLSSLYIAAGGIYININANATPLMNVALVAVGAVLANFVGTTGASLLLIRPFIRLNVHRIKPYQIIFFIFIVSNAGGLLTPLGDPPLFIGFLKGVPFFWTLQHLFVPWVVAITVLCLIFFLIDRRNKEHFTPSPEVVAKNREKTEWHVTGKRNLIWLGVVIGAIFLDPNVVEGLPYIAYDGGKLSFLREIIQLSAAFMCYRYSSKSALAGNQFSFGPILEVVFLFFGIFFTMMPALQLSAAIASAPEYARFITPNFLYWATGSLSGFLDNAPTYANFLSLAMAKYDMAQNSVVEVRQFAMGTGATGAETIVLLEAISLASVLFGAFTYIGNGPNFMVKAIAESAGIKMPSFFAYVIRYSIPFLLPALLLVWFLVVHLRLF